MKQPSRYSDEPGVSIDPTRVPEEFRHLVPLAIEWSIGDDCELDEYIANQSKEILTAVTAAFDPHFRGLQEWSEANCNVVPQPDEIVLFDTATNAIATVFTKLR